MPHTDRQYPFSAPDSAWYLHIDDPTNDRDATIVYADFHVATPPPIATGEKVTYDFVFGAKSNHGETNPLAHYETYKKFRELAHHAGDYVTFETPASRVAYREQTPADAPSLLIGLEPAYETPVSGCWGLIDNINDESPLPQEVVELSLTVHVIAPFDEFDTFHDVEDERST